MVKLTASKAFQVGAHPLSDLSVYQLSECYNGFEVTILKWETAPKLFHCSSAPAITWDQRKMNIATQTSTRSKWLFGRKGINCSNLYVGFETASLPNPCQIVIVINAVKTFDRLSTYSPSKSETLDSVLKRVSFPQFINFIGCGKFSLY